MKTWIVFFLLLSFNCFSWSDESRQILKILNTPSPTLLSGPFIARAELIATP